MALNYYPGADDETDDRERMNSRGAMNMHEKLKVLRKVIAAECDRRIKKDHRFAGHEVAEWLIRRKRKAVIDGLADLVYQFVDQRNDDISVERVLRAKPELRVPERALRGISQALGVPLWFMLEKLDNETNAKCCAAACLVSRLQAEEAIARLDMAIQLDELLAPICEGRPDMTVGEAMRELQRRTDETIHGLGPPEEAA
jgi:hypothetical protein